MVQSDWKTSMAKSKVQKMFEDGEIDYQNFKAQEANALYGTDELFAKYDRKNFKDNMIALDRKIAEKFEDDSGRDGETSYTEESSPEKSTYSKSYIVYNLNISGNLID